MTNPKRKKKYYATYKCQRCSHGEYAEIPKGRKECVMCGGVMAMESMNPALISRRVGAHKRSIKTKCERCGRIGTIGEGIHIMPAVDEIMGLSGAGITQTELVCESCLDRDSSFSKNVVTGEGFNDFVGGPKRKKSCSVGDLRRMGY